MKPTPILAASLCAALCLGAILLHSGCESADDCAIEVTPAYSEVRAVGQSVTLTASGWSGYTWSLSSEEWGYLTARNGTSVRYVVTKMPEAAKSDADVTVTATGHGTGDWSSSSNKTSSVAGTAKIRHISPAK